MDCYFGWYPLEYREPRLVVPTILWLLLDSPKVPVIAVISLKFKMILIRGVGWCRGSVKVLNWGELVGFGVIQ